MLRPRARPKGLVPMRTSARRLGKMMSRWFVFRALVFLAVLCVSCCGVQVQIDMEQAWKGLSLVGMADEARCTAAQAGFGSGCMAQ